MMKGFVLTINFFNVAPPDSHLLDGCCFASAMWRGLVGCALCGFQIVSDLSDCANCGSAGCYRTPSKREGKLRCVRTGGKSQRARGCTTKTDEGKYQRDAFFSFFCATSGLESWCEIFLRRRFFRVLPKWRNARRSTAVSTASLGLILLNFH